MITIGSWVKVGDYHVIIHELTQLLVPSRRQGAQPPPITLINGIVIEAAPETYDRVVFINVEYRNRSRKASLSCRRNQWVLYDIDGYSYDASWNEQMYQQHGLRYFGGDRIVNPNTNARGWLGFIVPFDAPVLRVQFLTGFLGTKSADIYLDSDMWHSTDARKRLASGE